MAAVAEQAGGRRLLVLGVARRAPADDAEVRGYYDELERLAQSAGATVAEVRVQVRRRPDPKTHVGPGFAQAAAERITEAADGPDAVHGVLLAEEVAPRVLAELAERMPVPVEDRTHLILGIFASRARSAEGRLQVELAQLSYTLPRLAGRRRGLSRQGGGIGVRGGAGESALELDRRRLRQRIAELRREVVTLRQGRAERLEGRGDLPRIALVGYTNAGKTTLLGALARRDEGGQDRLFDTLDPTTRRIRHGAFGEALLTDTVGFVRDLPPGLIEAFEATLAEVRDADLLVHVVNAASPTAEAEAAAVRTILGRIGAENVPEILVASHAPHGRLPAGSDLGPDCVAVDSPTGAGLEVLFERVGRALEGEREPVVLEVPADRWDLVSFARTRGPVSLTQRDDGGVRLVAHLRAPDAARLRRALGRG